MELMRKQGYKQTEVGLIPEDWEVFVLSDVLNGIADVNHYMPKTEKNGIPYVMTGDLKEQVGDIDFDNCKKIHLKDFKELSKKVKNLKGDIILARYATIGTVSFVNIDFDFIVSYSCVTIKPDTSKLRSLFLFYYFKSDIFKLEVYNKVNANIQDNVGIGDLYKMQIPLPPTLTEQKVIATAFSDVDALIASLEQTITKKKAIKQGAMQQLLTPPHKGGKRLPGFSGEWVEKTLGKVANYQNGKALESYFNSSDGYKVVSIGNYSESGIYVNNNNFISKTLKSEIGKFILNEGELAMLLNDKTSIGTIIGRVLYIDKNEEYVFNQRTMRLSLNEGYNSRFLFHLINCNIVHQQIFLKAKPGTQIYINTADVLDLVLALPLKFEEQKAIAQILSDMDAEITQLETKKEKYQAIKQGMMQELLTGKTRLV